MAQIKTKFIQDSAVTNAKVATGIDAAKLADGSVSNTEFQYLQNVSGDLQTQLNDRILSSEKGANNGVATLDSGGKIPVNQLPNSVMEYKGNWNASTNSPSLADGVGNAGDVYRINVAGTQNLGSGSITFEVGDWVVYNGSIWEKSINSNAVVSVNGQSGIVTLDSDDISEGSTNLYFTDERAQDAVGQALVDTASIDFTYSDASGEIRAAVIPGGVDHDQLLNFSANEHVDHSSVQIATGANSGLAGGGDITTTRNLSLDPNNATQVSAASGDFLAIADVSDSNSLKKVTVQSILDLVPGATPYTGGLGISVTGYSIAVDQDGQGLQFVGNQLTLELDGSTLSKSASGLKVADLGIGTGQLADDAVTAAKIASDVAGSGLAQGASGELNINLAASSGLEIVTDELKAKVDSSTVKINGSNQLESLKEREEIFTLGAGDITNQYVDLAHAAYGASASINSVSLSVVGGPVQEKGVDYTVSLTGGSGGVTRISFAGDLATGGNAALVATDKLIVKYSYLT